MRHAMRFELGLYVALARWVLRRPLVAPGQERIGYSRDVTPVLGLWIFASAAEIPLLHVLLPWPAARTMSLVIGAWGLFWMLGLLASYRVRPHVVGDHGLRVRNGPLVDVPLDWADIAAVRPDRRDLPSSARAVQPLETPDGTDLRIGVSGQVNVSATLARPVVVRLPDRTLEVTSVSFFVDDQREVVAALRRRLAALAE